MSEASPAAGLAKELTGALAAIFSPEATDRDRAVAMYEAVVRGKTQDRNAALALLKQVYADPSRSGANSAHDPQVLEALGFSRASMAILRRRSVTCDSSSSSILST